MRQLTYVQAGKLRWDEVSEPSLGSDRGALVRPIAVATCDLDGLIIAGESPFDGPFALGHECVAEVVDVGDDVRDVTVGQRVVVPFQVSCGACDACLRGRTGNCQEVPRSSTYGFGPHVDRFGGFLSDIVSVPYADHMLVAVPDGLDPVSVASASDNIPDGWRAVAPGLMREPGAPVLVVGGWGPGSIGLYAIASALALGSDRVVFAGKNAQQRAVAESLGAEVVAEPFPRRLGPFAITVSATGDPDELALAIRSTAPDGLCTSTGIFLGEQPTLPLLEMYEKVMTFHTGRSHARPNIPFVLEQIAAGALASERVTTMVVDWEQAPDALAEAGWIKLVIERAAITRSTMHP